MTVEARICFVHHWAYYVPGTHSLLNTHLLDGLMHLGRNVESTKCGVIFQSYNMCFCKGIPITQKVQRGKKGLSSLSSECYSMQTILSKAVCGRMCGDPCFVLHAFLAP